MSTPVFRTDGSIDPEALSALQSFLRFDAATGSIVLQVPIEPDYGLQITDTNGTYLLRTSKV